MPRQCSDCGETLPSSEFQGRRGKKCSVCRRWKRVLCYVEKTGLPFDLTRKQWFEIVSKRCHYCWQKNKSSCIGIDRLNNDESIGYTLTNSVSCCPDCNRIRADRLTPSEMKILGNFIQFAKAYI